MDNFKDLIENNLSLLLKEKKIAKTSFIVSMNLKKYELLSDDPNLQKTYAKRDTKGAIELTKQILRNRFGRTPLNTKISAKFKKLSLSRTFFSIYVESKKGFIEKIKKEDL